eukprot:12954089-Heterocapsa_arctica.AAC.1
MRYSPTSFRESDLARASCSPSTETPLSASWSASCSLRQLDRPSSSCAGLSVSTFAVARCSVTRACSSPTSPRGVGSGARACLSALSSASAQKSS